MGTSEVSASGRYLLGDGPAEIRHLVEQAELYAYEANELLDLIGVAANTTAIDVGCGVMGVLHLLAERVGADGRVVGLDREARMVEFGRQLAEQRGLAVEFLEADATATGLPDRAFDLVHARTLLLNVQNPEQILTDMVRIARPCGVVAVQEPDASAWNCDHLEAPRTITCQPVMWQAWGRATTTTDTNRSEEPRRGRSLTPRRGRPAPTTGGISRRVPASFPLCAESASVENANHGLSAG